MTAAQAAVVNESLEAIGNQVQITDLNDGSPAGNAAGVIYLPTIQMLLRQMNPDFARKRVVLTSATGTPIPPYLFEYLYPSDCLRIREVTPAPGSYDPYDPQPVRKAVATDIISTVITKVILTNQASAALVYTSSNVGETVWDMEFRQVVVNQLATPLSMALAGRPDFAKALFERATQIARIAEENGEG